MFIHYMVIVLVLAFIIYLHITDKFVRLVTKGFLQAIGYVTVFGIVFYLFVEAIAAVFSK